VMLALAAFFGYLLAVRALAPLEQMAIRAEQITASRLHERLPANEGGELGHLAQVFNATLARLEQSFEQLRRFTSDASHELRTPLTAIRSVGEVGLQKDATREDYRDIIGSMLEEVNRLTRLIDNLLTMSRADSGTIQLHPATFRAFDLARETAEVIEVLAEDKSQHLHIDGNRDVQVHGDRLFLRQALLNVLHNAVKFSPVEGTIAVTVRANGQDVVIEVADSGPGITEEHREKIFRRFYRVDEARSREAGGSGLGLSIAQWAVQAHGGSIAVTDHSPQGCVFAIRLPQG
jgi:heavy metal sensor kinase